MSSTPLVAVPVETHRLSQTAYGQVESKFKFVGFPKDGIEAAYRTGINDVLYFLRQNIVTGA